MTNKEKLFEEINLHTKYWDGYNDCPVKYNHTGKVLKIFKENSVSFSLFCAENTFGFSDGLWRMKLLKPTFKTIQELYKMWENDK